MAVFDVFNPLATVTPRFTEEQLGEIIEWFDEKAKPVLSINEGEPIMAVTIEVFMDFLGLNKYHRRNFHTPSYQELMTLVEKLQMDTYRLLTKEQCIYILDSFILEPEIKHEVLLAFQIFDTEKRGYLEIDEIQNIVTNYGDVFTREEVIEMTRDANVRGDGIVHYEEFVESMFTIAPELYNIKVEYLYEDPDEDISVPPLPEPPKPPTPPPEPAPLEAPLETPPPPETPPSPSKESKKK